MVFMYCCIASQYVVFPEPGGPITICPNGICVVGVDVCAVGVVGVVGQVQTIWSMQNECFEANSINYSVIPEHNNGYPRVQALFGDVLSSVETGTIIDSGDHSYA